jgi:hypothetical protein
VKPGPAFAAVYPMFLVVSTSARAAACWLHCHMIICWILGAIIVSLCLGQPLWARGHVLPTKGSTCTIVHRSVKYKCDVEHFY